eukprot:TRINITY_DN4179_c0_g1_i3.p1 TRINITY_DN4179_c0_g1~~TRINITY_DN4179_c0_g1_i3.p1  ORF type:complete len:102 (-),score=18.14 TRINITY_DN4179_c0_g1_i3:154-459(-)
MDEELPPLKNFILPVNIIFSLLSMFAERTNQSGGLASSSLHVCRAVTRRAERSIFQLVEEGDCDDAAAKYLNRLSDFFFVAARYASMKQGKPEVVYKKSQT